MLPELLARLEELASVPGAVPQLRALAIELAVSGAFTETSTKAANRQHQPLDQVADILTGTSINAEEKSLKYDGLTDGLPYIATKDVDGATGKIDYKNGIRIPEDEPGFKVAPPGTILICAEGGSAGKKIGLTDRPVCFGNKLFAVSPNDVTMPEYLLQVMRSRDFYDQFSSRMSGIIGGVSLKKFKEIPVFVPSVAHQKFTANALSAVLDTIERINRQTKAADAAKALVVQASLQDLLQAHEPTELELRWSDISAHFDDWFDNVEAIGVLRRSVIDLAISGCLPGAASDVAVSTTLGELTAFGPKNGRSPKPVLGPTDTKTMSLAATTKGVFDPSAFKYVEERPPADSELWVQPGDILLQRANTLEYVGVSAVYTGLANEFIYPDLMMRITPRDGVDSSFLHLALSCSSAREFMRNRASGTSGSMPKINQATVRSIPVRLPSIDRQKIVVGLVRDLTGLCDVLENRIKRRTEEGLQLLNAWIEGRTDGETGGGSGGPHVSEGITDESVPNPSDSTDAQIQQVSISSITDLSTMSSRHGDGRVFEAALVSAVVRAFYERANEPIGNFRLQKAVYFARRRLNDQDITTDYLEKAAGPYNPKMRYSGGIAIAKSAGWIREARGRFGFGHIIGANAALAEASVELKSVACWVRDTFLMRKNDEWERLATVDYAMLALRNRSKPVTARSVLAYIANLDVWRHKVVKLGLTEFHVKSTMLEVSALLGEPIKVRARASR